MYTNGRSVYANMEPFGFIFVFLENFSQEMGKVTL